MKKDNEEQGDEEQIAALRQDIKNQLMDRALMVNGLIKALGEVFDQAGVIKTMQQALYQQGVSKARRYLEQTGQQALTPADAAAVLQQNAPDGGRLFPVACQQDDQQTCTVQVLSCPLKQAMQQAGASPEEFAALVAVLDASTSGFIEGLGLAVDTKLPALAGDACCRIQIRPAAQRQWEEENAGSDHA